MDQDGLFLMIKMCNNCSFNKGNWKKCLSRRHNPRMSGIRYEELALGHRLCVKPDQSITIYKLRDNETNEEFLEFDESIAFQTACKECVNIKTCIDAGHELVDWWPPKIVGDQAEGTPLDPDPPTDEETVSNTIPASTTTSNSVNRSINNSNTKKKRAKKGNKSPAQGNVGKGSRSTSASSLSSRDGSGSPASGAATAAPAANGNVTWSGGTSGDGRGKGKVKAAAGQQKQSALKPSSKRKLPSARGSPPANSKRISMPRSAGSRQSSAGMRRPKGRRSSRGGASSPPLEEEGSSDDNGGEGDGDDDNLDRAPKMEIDTSVGTSIGSSDVDAESHERGRRPPKRRAKDKAPALVTPSPKRLDFLKTTNPCREWALEKFRFAEQTDSREAFDTSVNPAEGNDRINGGTAASAASCADPSVVISRSCEEVDEAATAAAPPAAQKTVAERLEVVKAEEAELLRQFEQVHKRCAKEEATKRAEIEEFVRAGEEALRIMREAKEEALRRISRAGKKKGEERRKLTQLRLEEFEAAEEAARAEARERDARLEAERERLARNWEPNALADGVSVSSVAPELADGDSAATVADPSASGKEAVVSSGAVECPSGGESVDGVPPTSDGSPASTVSAASVAATEKNVCSSTDISGGRAEPRTRGNGYHGVSSGSHGGGGEEPMETTGLGRSRGGKGTVNGSAACGGRTAGQALATRSCTPRDQTNGDAPQQRNGVNLSGTPTEALFPRL